MIEKIQKYAETKGLPLKDALQVFLQVIVLKGMHFKDARLIGGTALVTGHGNPRFSEDIDLTGVPDPLGLKPHLERSAKEVEGLLNAKVSITHPKQDRVTWRLSCNVTDALFARLHVDSQDYPALSEHPIMIEYPGIAPFVFASITIDEIMADKLVALAFRKNIGGRDIFDLWYHWLKTPDHIVRTKTIQEYVLQKLELRGLKKGDMLSNIRTKLAGGITKRVEEEWSRYLPAGLKNAELYKQIFDTVKSFVTGPML